MLKGTVVAELPPSRPGLRRWMAIIPGDEELVCTEFEHADDLDTDDYPAPDDIINRSRAAFTDLEVLLRTLTSAGIDTDVFTEPWKTDYPG
jgi:hypothetical protein